jgi:NADPH:quinone reductase-like Zn-dependent oxidoreductase
MLAVGRLHIPIEKAFPLTAAGVADAHRASMTGHVAGKLVVVP